MVVVSMELSVIIQTSCTWELVYISYEASPGNQTGENDSSSFRESSRPPLKGGSIHFHHQKTRNAKVHRWDPSLLSWQVFKSPLGRSSNLLLAGLQKSRCSRIHLTRCCSGCSQSSLCCAERAPHLPLSLCLWRLQHISLSSADSDALHSVSRSLLQRNVSWDDCLLHPDLVSRDRGHLYAFIEDSTNWSTYVYFQTLEYGNNTGGDWFMHVFGAANACMFVHRLSACQQRVVQMDRHTFHLAATLGGACSGSPPIPQSLI